MKRLFWFLAVLTPLMLWTPAALAETAAQAARMERSALLAEADGLVEKGELMQAGALLSRSFATGGDRATGERLAAVRNRQGRHREAAQVYALLMRDFPQDAALTLLYAEALAKSGEREKALLVLEPLMRSGNDPAPHAAAARIYLQQGRLNEARDEYETAKQLGGGADLAAERKAVEEAIALRHARELVADGGYELAQPLLQSMSASGSFQREARILSAQTLLAQGHRDEALSHGAALHAEYPDDAEASVLYAEALAERGRGAEAQEVLEGIGGSAGVRVRCEREDLFCRVRGNWVRIIGDLYRFSGGTPDESGVGVSVARRFHRVTAVATVSETTRFRRTDPQLSLDLYFPPGEGGRLSGALYLSTAPGSSFLPRYSAGGEVGWSLSAVDLFAGYQRVAFHRSPVDLASAGLTWHLPGVAAAFAEKVFVVPQSGSALAVTTLSWNATFRLRAWLSAGAGNASERRVAREDLRRHDTWLVRGGAEYRFSPRCGIGGEGTFESRRRLYDRTGGALYLRYWWP